MKKDIAFFIMVLMSFFSNSCTENNKGKTSVYQEIITSSNIDVQKKKFDIEKYELNIKKDPSYEGYWKDKNTYIKQYHIIKDGYVEETYTKDLVESYVEEIIKNDRYRDVYTFDKTGSLQSVKHYFGSNLEIGKWLYYKKDVIVKTENKDENYAFTLEEVLKYGKTQKVDFTKTGEISKTTQSGVHVWELDWNTGKISEDGESYLFKKVILDGNTGKEISTKEYYSHPFVR
ncbi:hypothetical protein [Chryseobacterium sp. CT-SW4]|uniref:hypothetical protein n=1 Tax=Chryseobacterium sp. SW-1 TaxID=3157343 RepID=UPI003B027D0B